MPNIVCPECSTQTFIDDSDGFLDGTPDEFCRNCDFPLFWAPKSAIRDEIEVTADVGGDQRGIHPHGDPGQPPMRRLPGTEGLESSTGVPCPHCRELNDPDRVRCWRCGNLMVPEVVVEESQLVDEAAEAVPDVPEVPRYWDPPSWLLVALGVVLVALVALILVVVL